MIERDLDLMVAWWETLAAKTVIGGVENQKRSLRAVGIDAEGDEFEAKNQKPPKLKDLAGGAKFGFRVGFRVVQVRLQEEARGSGAREI